MQAAPKAIGQVPYNSPYPRKTLHPSHHLPRSQSEKTRARGSFCSLLIVSALCLTPLALLNLTIHTYLTQASYSAVHLKADIEEEKATQEKLNVAVTTMSSPERIQKVATEKLLMKYPEDISFITLPDQETSPLSLAQLPKEEASR